LAELAPGGLGDRFGAAVREAEPDGDGAHRLVGVIERRGGGREGQGTVLVNARGRRHGRSVTPEIRYTGVRPGEKLLEELGTEGEDTQPTAHLKVFAGAEDYVPSSAASSAGRPR
jgi:hypothetical protein